MLQHTFLDDDLPEGNYVFWEVSDSGCGMDEETKARIFDPFFTTKFTGRGLGLASVLGIVRGHKGAIEIESQPGQGTTFTVMLPASERPLLEKPKREPATALAAQPARRGTILVAEDEELVRRTVQAVLEKAGYSVLMAKDGREAVDLFAKNSQEIDLVFLDLTMPELNGHQALVEMRRIEPATPVILTSGYCEEQATSEFASDHLAGFVQKPYRLADFLEKVGRVLEKSS